MSKIIHIMRGAPEVDLAKIANFLFPSASCVSLKSFVEEGKETSKVHDINISEIGCFRVVHDEMRNCLQNLIVCGYFPHPVQLAPYKMLAAYLGYDMSIITVLGDSRTSENAAIAQTSLPWSHVILSAATVMAVIAYRECQTK